MYPNGSSPHLPLVFTDHDRLFLSRLRIRPDGDIAGDPRELTEPPRPVFRSAEVRQWETPDSRMREAQLNLRKTLGTAMRHPQRMVDAYHRAPAVDQMMATDRCKVAEKYQQSCECGHPNPHPACYL